MILSDTDWENTQYVAKKIEDDLPGVPWVQMSQRQPLVGP